LLRQAAAIKLVVDHEYALPAGLADTLDLISDPAALAGFVSTVNADDPAALTDAIAIIVADPDVIVPTTLQDFVGIYSLVFELGAPGTVSGRYVQGARVILAADGTGKYIEEVPNADPSVSWSFDAGRAILTLNSPVARVSYPFAPDGSGQVRQLASVLRVELSQLFEGAARDTFAVATITGVSYPDNPQIPGFSRTAATSNLAIRDEGGSIPYIASELIGTRSLRIEGPPNLSASLSGSALFTFMEDGLGVRADERSFNWSIGAFGRLSVTYANGDAAVYIRIVDDGRGGEGVIGDIRMAGGLRSSAMATSARRDGFAFNDGNTPNSWRSGFYVGSTAIGMGDFFVVLDPDQSAWLVTYSASNEVFSTVAGWSVSDGVMDATSYISGTGWPTNYCEVGVNGCYIQRMRRWRPIAADGDRIYVLEEFLTDYNLDGSLEVTEQRTNFYDAGPRPPFRVAKPGSSSAAKILKTTAKAKAR
jgi:hypothetical protein